MAKINRTLGKIELMTAFTGKELIDIAKAHLEETYVFGATPGYTGYHISNYNGPWDCAEFASWCVYQASAQTLQIGLVDWNAYTGYWETDALNGNNLVSIGLAKAENTA